jgi:hypothetical protein
MYRCTSLGPGLALSLARDDRYREVRTVSAQYGTGAEVSHAVSTQWLIASTSSPRASGGSLRRSSRCASLVGRTPALQENRTQRDVVRATGVGLSEYCLYEIDL